uniref:Ig-like domain-containing protein n=1 Tax=Pundamilia nyererei TaxID=303518 RepID=A0A3B4FPR5_9CICH
MEKVCCFFFTEKTEKQCQQSSLWLNADDVSLPVVADTEVSCIFMESCMLRCSYSGSDVVIHWTQVSAGDLNVHSFYNNQDQLKLQSERFRGRTSLFNDQIAAGNASLQLKMVEVQDEGRYKCYTSTDGGNQESFINLKIKGKKQNIYIYSRNFSVLFCFFVCFFHRLNVCNSKHDTLMLM